MKQCSKPGTGREKSKGEGGRKKGRRGRVRERREGERGMDEGERKGGVRMRARRKRWRVDVKEND